MDKLLVFLAVYAPFKPMFYWVNLYLTQWKDKLFSLS